MAVVMYETRPLPATSLTFLQGSSRVYAEFVQLYSRADKDLLWGSWNTPQLSITSV